MFNGSVFKYDDLTVVHRITVRMNEREAYNIERDNEVMESFL